GRVKGPPDSPVMAGFMARLDEINALAERSPGFVWRRQAPRAQATHLTPHGTTALAERSPGFVWRLQPPAGNATDLRPYDDDTILINMSVWQGLEELRAYVFESSQRGLLRQRLEARDEIEG